MTVAAPTPTAAIVASTATQPTGVASNNKEIVPAATLLPANVLAAKLADSLNYIHASNEYTQHIRLYFFSNDRH